MLFIFFAKKIMTQPNVCANLNPSIYEIVLSQQSNVIKTSSFWYNERMKRIVVFLVVAIAISGVYFKYRPAVTYYIGKISASFQHYGKVAGSGVYLLNVPFHRQEHALSCEVASLKMALAGVGLEVSEAELIASLPVDRTPKINNTWGDPYNAFMGNIDGRMMSTGYGVYWDPIAKVGLRHRRTESIQNGSLQQLIYHLNQNRPVIVWGYYGSGNREQWVTPSGRTINGINGEHARVLVGYTGNMLNPETVLLMDPIYGHLEWKVTDFLNNWAALENGAVVVYKHPRWVKTANSGTVWELNGDGTLKHGLDMSWETFVQGGGVGEGIKIVEEHSLNAVPAGELYKTLP
jgi:uncharacterized protein YvpB